jgi:nitrate reductase NapE component
LIHLGLYLAPDLQEGYNPDLLEAQPNSRATPVLRGGAATPSKSKYAGASDDGHFRNPAVAQPPPTKTRSRKVLFIIVGVVLLVIVAVGVGVGVGVSKSRQQSGEVIPPGTAVPPGNSTQLGQSDSSPAQTSKTTGPAAPTKTNPSSTSDGAGPGGVVAGTDADISGGMNAPASTSR